VPERRFPFFAVWTAVAGAALAGCAMGPVYVSQTFAPPAQVAVLPFGNETNDVSGPESVRKLLAELLPMRGYRVMPLDKVDKVLEEKFGITDGGQLNVATPEEIGKALKTDGLIYGNLISFVDLPLGFARKRTVKAEFRLVDAKSGERLWEDKKGWTTPELHIDAEEAKGAAVRQVAERQLQKMTGQFLRNETLMVLHMALQTLPPGPDPAVPPADALRPHFKQFLNIPVKEERYR
jgi:hypothetical protein